MIITMKWSLSIGPIEFNDDIIYAPDYSANALDDWCVKFADISISPHFSIQISIPEKINFYSKYVLHLEGLVTLEFL